MPTAAPLTGEVFLDRLAERLCSMYEHCLKFERQKMDFARTKYLVLGSVLKTKEEFAAWATMLKSADPLLDVWVEFEGELDAAAEALQNMSIASTDVTDTVRSLLTSLLRYVKKGWPAKTAMISAKMKELDSRRVPVSVQ